MKLSALALLLLATASARAASTLTLDPLAATQPSINLGTESPRTSDYASRLTLYWENDGGFVKPNADTDRHYTAGVGASLAFQAPFIKALLSNIPSFNNEFAREQSDYAAGLVGSLNIFTPTDLSNPNPIYNDRPYAGWTYAGLFLQRANRTLTIPTYESLEFDLGILGPSSLAENAQEMIHHEERITTPEGWNNQIHDEPEFNLQYNRRWKFKFFQSDQFHLSAEALPEWGFTAGTLEDEIHAGSVLRLGYNMPDDFGPGNLHRPADFTYAAPCTCNWQNDFSLENILRDQSFYIFARPFGQLTAHDATLQGDNFRHDDPVTVNPEWGTAGLEYGLDWRLLQHFELTYTQTYESPTFEHQHAFDSFASLQLSFFIAW